jgi:asparagine synthase (glutamine-hydrolysing)
VVEFLFSLPPPLTNGKRVLRKTVARFGAPDPPRRKRGFEVPLAAWLRGPLRETVARCLDSPRVDELGLDRKVLSSTWEAHLQKDADHAERLLAVAILVRWTEEWT